MRAVDEDIRAAALSAGRHIAVAVEIAAKSGGEYITKQTLQSEIEYIKITVGGDSDGVTIGKTYCAQLVLKIPRYIDIAETDRLIVRVGYDTGVETTTGKMSLGWFYVDNIEINGYVATVTAFDIMIHGAKNYISALDYPAVLPNVLDEVCLQIGLSLDSSVTVPEYTINTPPIRGKDKDGNTLYYSKRQMLGFIGSLMGGNWFINGGGHLDISKITDSVDTISADNVFESDINADVFTVTGISWNTGNQTLKRQDVDARGVIEFFNPLNIIEEPIIAKLEMALVGKSYYGGKIKRQGAGWHEIGDVVTVPIDKNGNTKPILLTGIERVFENGGYTETWQSCAQTESEANYTVDSGADVSGTSAAEYLPLSEYEYLTDLSVRCNGVTYTVEKDADTGLIAKISDSNGNSFDPTVNSGITDTALHNAVFWAVAMARGIGNPQFVMDGIFGMFTPDTRDIANNRWRNSISGYNDMTLTGGSVSENAVHFTASQYGTFTCDEPNTVYAIVKSEQSEAINCIITKKLTVLDGSVNYGFNLLQYSGQMYFSAAGNDILQPEETALPNTEYHCYCYTRSGVTTKFYVDGVFVGSAGNCNTGRYSGLMYLNNELFGSGIIDEPTVCDFVMCAFGSQYHDDATVQKNMAYLMKKYGL